METLLLAPTYTYTYLKNVTFSLCIPFSLLKEMEISCCLFHPILLKFNFCSHDLSIFRKRNIVLGLLAEQA